MKLIEAANISVGYPFRGSIDECRGSGVRVVQMKDISYGGGISWETVAETTLSGKKNPDWINQGDILFAARGSRNYSVIVDKLVAQVVSAPQFYILRMNTDQLLPEFLVWQLNAKPLQAYFSKSAEGSMTKSIRRAILEEAEIRVPSIPYQQEILKIYTIMQRKKELYNELTKNTDKLMNAIADDLFAPSTNSKRNNTK